MPPPECFLSFSVLNTEAEAEITLILGIRVAKGQFTPMLKHTEDPDCIHTAECPAAAAAQLQCFSYSRTYSSPPGDLLGDPDCECQG
jgi:hypothetical protein